jgi:hypothetical protein
LRKINETLRTENEKYKNKLKAVKRDTNYKIEMDQDIYNEIVL